MLGLEEGAKCEQAATTEQFFLVMDNLRTYEPWFSTFVQLISAISLIIVDMSRATSRARRLRSALCFRWHAEGEPETPDMGARGFSAMGPKWGNYPLRARMGRGGFSY